MWAELVSSEASTSQKASMADTPASLSETSGELQRVIQRVSSPASMRLEPTTAEEEVAAAAADVLLLEPDELPEADTEGPTPFTTTLAVLEAVGCEEAADAEPLPVAEDAPVADAEAEEKRYCWKLSFAWARVRSSFDLNSFKMRSSCRDMAGDANSGLSLGGLKGRGPSEGASDVVVLDHFHVTASRKEVHVV